MCAIRSPALAASPSTTHNSNNGAVEPLPVRVHLFCPTLQPRVFVACNHPQQIRRRRVGVTTSPGWLQDHVGSLMPLRHRRHGGKVLARLLPPLPRLLGPAGPAGGARNAGEAALVQPAALPPLLLMLRPATCASQRQQQRRAIGLAWDGLTRSSQVVHFFTATRARLRKTRCSRARAAALPRTRVPPRLPPPS